MHDDETSRPSYALLMEHLEEIIFKLSWDEVLLVPDNMKWVIDHEGF